MKRFIATLAAASSLSGCIPFYCVGRGTWVATPGKKRLIEELVVGDEIIAVEPKSGQHAFTTITAIVSAEKECGVLRFADGTTLTVTGEHPVFDPSDLDFHPAAEWFSGVRSSLLRFEDGKFEVAAVAERAPFFDVRTVFDLTVASPWHTFVADGVVVHNKSPLSPKCVPPDGGAPTRDLHGDRCSCGDAGVGTFSCDVDGEPYVCDQCQPR